LESLGLRDTAKLSADEMKEVAWAGLQQVMRKSQDMKNGEHIDIKSIIGGEKLEVKSFVGSDYTATDPSRGGIFVTPQMNKEVIMLGMREINPILNEITLTTHATSGTIQIPVKTGEFRSAVAGEMQNAPKADKPKWSLLDIPMHRYVGEGACTMEILSGSTVDFRATVMQDIMIELSNGYQDDFTFGNGAGKAQGWTLGDYAELESIVSGKVIPDDLIFLQNEIKEQDQAGSKYYFNRRVLSQILTEKDLEGGYLFQMIALNGIGGFPSIAGKPYAIIPSLAGAPTSGQRAVYYGNLQRAARYVQWGGSFMKRDETTHFSHGVFEYAMARMAGGRVINTEVLAALTIKA
ncbi:MAG: phage major capsid protein, partial [Flavobacteriales bacterium]